MTCATCAFAEPRMLDDGPQLECHRYPPQIVTLDSEAVQVRPQMRADDWCGEYREQP